MLKLLQVKFMLQVVYSNQLIVKLIYLVNILYLALKQEERKSRQNVINQQNKS
jgi:hypothetical protein